jgi:hypothetical protein
VSKPLVWDLFAKTCSIFRKEKRSGRSWAAESTEYMPDCHHATTGSDSQRVGYAVVGKTKTQSHMRKEPKAWTAGFAPALAQQNLF